MHLLGKCDSDLITEYFPVYLESVILGTKPDSESYKSSESSQKAVGLPELSTRRILEMALDAARGLQAMHEVDGGPIVHADLQPRQLLLDGNGVVKINDLNRCRFMGRDEEGNPCPFRIAKGNGVWRAPEEFHGDDGVRGRVQYKTALKKRLLDMSLMAYIQPCPKYEFFIFSI